MSRRWLHSSQSGILLLVLLFPLYTSGAPHEQCLVAQTPAACRVALPSCAAAYKSLDSRREDAESLRDQLLIRWADCENSLGMFADAERHYRDLHALRLRRFGSQDHRLVLPLNNLANTLESQSKYAESEALHRQVLALRRKLFGHEHVEVAASLNNLAAVLESEGRYPEAASMYLQSLELRRKLLGAEHAEVTQSLNNLAGVFMHQGKYAEAEPLSRQVLQLDRKRLGDDHHEIAGDLNNLAVIVELQGKTVEAEQLLRQALQLQKKFLGEQHPDVAQSLANLAGVLSSHGKYAESERLCRQALELRQKIFGDEGIEVLQSTNQLVLLLNNLGKYAEAEQLGKKGLQRAGRRLSTEHPEMIAGSIALAEVLASQKKYADAETLLREVIPQQKKLLGAEHPEVAYSLNRLALALIRQDGQPKKHAEAESISREVLALRKKTLGAKNPSVAESLNITAFVLDVQKKSAEAESLYLEALAFDQKQLGPDHPNSSGLLVNLAALYLAQGSTEKALPLLRQLAPIRESQLRSIASETRMQALLDKLRGEEDMLYGLLLSMDDSGLNELALTTALLRKGRVADAGAVANLLTHRSLRDGLLVGRFADWQVLRQRREALLYAGPGALPASAFRERLNALKLQAEELEYKLGAELPVLHNLQPPPFEEILPSVARQLPKDGVLVEILWAKPYRFESSTWSARWGEPHLIALLLFPNRRIVRVDLGSAAAVDSRSRSLLEVISNVNVNPEPAAQALHQQIFAPLLPHLQGVRDLYLSLDGTLNLIPFHALHDAQGYLLGRYRFHYLTSGRDLLRQPSRRSTEPPLFLANPDFGNVEPSASAAPAQSLYHRLRELAPLDGTQMEAERLRPLLGVQPLLRAAATEEAVRKAHAPRILHIATHGLFLRDVELHGAAASRGVTRFEPQRSQDVSAAIAEQLPGEALAMDRSTLVLAGVRQGHRAGDTTRDGLLTAEEARSLDLDGTQLVVLSACETGQGELAAGQGVYGLRRAFLVAGAETLVTSLWRVHDTATGELMELYYRKLLDARQPADRIDAMALAMRELKNRPGRAHPYYWAPFLVIGQSGPLRAK